MPSIRWPELLRFPGHQFPGRLARLIHRRTEGNPLFMVNLVQHLVNEEIVFDYREGWHLRSGLEAVESGVPENVRLLIEKHIERLGPDERRVLEGASVVGMECSSAAIAAVRVPAHPERSFRPNLNADSDRC